MREPTVNSNEIDETFDFSAAGWDRDGCMNPDVVVKRAENFRRCAANVGDVDMTDDGGWPRMWWGRVVEVAMVSMWPYHRPRPSVRVERNGVSRWFDWANIVEVRPAQ